MPKFELTAMRKALVMCGLFVVATDANALQVGQITSHSRLGEPLNASVGLWLNSREKTEAVRFKVSPDLSYVNNPRLTELVNRIDAQLEYSPSGNAYIRLSTDAPLAEPVVAFRLKVYVNDVAVIRKFALAPRPPVVEVKNRAITTSKSLPRTKARRAPISGDSYRVRRGDTLWGIARRASQHSGTAASELVDEIFAGNLHAFVDGNRDRLTLDAELTIPTHSVSGVAPQVPSTKNVSLPTTIPAPQASDPEVSSETESTTPLGQTAGLDTLPIGNAETQASTPDVSAQLDALREKYAALMTRYEAQQQTPAETIETDATTSAPPSIASESVDSTADRQVTADDRPAAQIEASSLATVDDQATPIPADAPTSVLAAATTKWMTIGVMALFALALVFFATRKILKLGANRRAIDNHDAEEEDRKAQVARKAKSRIEMEGEVKRMLEQRGTEDAVPINSGALDPEPVTRNIDEQIASNIANGRYANAEAMLLEVIADAPSNVSAKLRLLEVYYMTEQIDVFCELSDDLHTNHRSDMGDDEWRRVVRMGKIIAPEHTPFSGPQAVGTSY